ncbi:non-ribosomal peptide synthetase [Amycolatopsis sp. H20-H5]|uniref:non-ribosomal peptide synthetase n=1 Tax=Amycolatopsis sp. H20-H5 TaxID=3046309 RepID=UPI002DB92B18|nr:non-ribosomal peptide synthetase [Amycolatopsis sp. H20-H5]MEC3980480.1 amino acid adenylation domain-containing protein [Amycolatopsis sp. H20-H5]
MTCPPVPTDPAASYTQESLWLVDNVSRRTGSPAYHEPTAFRIAGEVDAGALAEALRLVVLRHDALRTSFTGTADGLRTAVREDVPEVLTVLDLRHTAPGDAAVRAEAALAEDYRRPFDLAADPLLRGVLVLLPGGEALLGLTLHHLATDGWSNTLVLDELGQHYRSLRSLGSPAALPALPASFADHVSQERRDHEDGSHADSIAHWKKVLEGGPELLRLPLDHPRPPVQTFAGASRTIRVPKHTVSPLLKRCRKECRSTDFSVLLAAYALLLHRYTGQDEVTVGTTILNRDSDEALDVVGCFVNTAALVLTVDDDMTFRQLLAHAGDAGGEMLNHGHAPYPKVLDALDTRRDPSHNPVFQTMLTVLGRRPGLDLGEGVTTGAQSVERAASKFEIMLYVAETDDEFEFEVEFNTDLFTPETAERLVRHYARLLESLADGLDLAVSEVSFLPDDERTRILDVWNATAEDYPYATVVDMFEAQARRTPDAVATEFDGTALTYRELDLLTNQIARSILARRDGDATPFVGVYMERSLEMVVALVSIVKAGCAYVPIDPEYPADRIEYMIADANPSLILTQERHRALLAGGTAEIVALSITDTRTEDDSPVERTVTRDSPVYMIYTSGSTGRPKGVVNRHVSLFNRLYWMQSEYGLTGEDRVLQKTPFSFDVSVWEFFWPLMFGARIVVAKPGGHRDTDYLKRLIRDRGVTTTHFIPSMLNVFLEEDDLDVYCGSLRRVICSGEALTFAAVRNFGRALSCGLHNLYGPTEAAIDVSYWPCTTDYPGSIVPIGKPIANVRLYVLDKHRRLAPIGVPGELCIGGVALAIGYHHRDELTAKVFVDDPYGTEPGARLYRTGDLARFLPDGQLQYLGRIDNQVKLRGLRIEPDEIAATLLELPNVRDAAVVVRDFGPSRALVGYVVADGFDQQEVKTALARRLPDFMVPQVVMALPALPTTANGKLDRTALPDPHESLAGPVEVFTPPATERERELVRVWSEVLGTEKVGVDANFFRHGGDSILSIRVAAKLRERGYSVQVHDIFAHPTIRLLAGVLERGTAAEPVVAPLALLTPADRAALPGGITDAWPLTMLQAGMIYHTMLHEDSSVYHDVFDYEVTGEVRPDLLRRAVADVAAGHPQLRSTFDLETFDRPLQLVHTDLAVPVEVVDLPDTGQDEAVARLVAAERRRAFDLAEGPLVRIAAHVRSPGTMNLLVSFHHIVLDGWSVALVVEEIRSRYADLLAGRENEPGVEPISYGTYVELERHAVADPAQRAYWSGLLAEVPATLLSTKDVSVATARAAEPSTAGRIVPEELVEGVRRFAAGLGVPVKSAYLAAHLNVLGRLTGQRTVVTGLVSAGRPESTGGTELAGLFLNTLPFPVELRTESWAALTGRVLAAEQDSSPHRRFPLAEIQRLAGGTAAFDTVFNYTDFHVYTADPGEPVRITGARYFEQTSFDAVVHVHRDHFADHQRVFVNYDATRIDAERAERYLDEFLTAVTELVADSADIQAADGTSVVAATAPVVRAVRPPKRAPRSELERRVAEVVGLVLDTGDLGIDDDYLEFGVDSISAIRVVAKLRRVASAVTMADVFACRTIVALAARIGEDLAVAEETAGLLPFELAGGEEFGPGIVDAYPATAAQLDMIRATERDLAQAAYHDVFAYRVPLPLQGEPLRAALRRVMNAHDTFRTGFLLEREVPLQQVHASVEPCLDLVDDGDAWFESERVTAFDWAEPGLIRFAAHHDGSAGFVLTLGFHHSIIDGWSLSLFLRDVVTDYRAAIEHETVAPPEAPALRYREYVRAELAATESAEAKDFWASTLLGAPDTTLSRLTTAEPGPRWSETKLALDDARHEALLAAATRFRVPLKHVLLAAHLRALALLTGEADVVTGVFTNGRPEVDESEAVLGLFLNFLPLRRRIADQTWQDLAREVFDADRRALPHRRYPQARIRADLGRETLFPALFNYTRFTAYRGNVTEARWFEHVDVPLLVNAGHELAHERLVITFNADGRVLAPGTLNVVAGLYDEVLTHLVTAENAPVTELSPGIAAAADKLGLLL